MTVPCAELSRLHREAPHGTASRARRWVLLEHPGAWGRDALRDSGLPPEVVDQLVRWSRELPARVLLLRRPGGRSSPTGLRTLYTGVSAPTGSWIERFDLGDPRDALDLDLDALRDDHPSGGTPVNQPRYLVCTNGKHDPCCARDGLPVARELAGMVGERVWECSHVGGDRFAGNLVCLPDGQFYGHLDAATARVVVAANEAGELVLDHWRGRSCHPFAVQATEALVRQRLGLAAIGALQAVESHRDGAHVAVQFATLDGRQLHARVEVVPGTEPRALTCGGTPTTAPSYRLLELVER